MGIALQALKRAGLEPADYMGRSDGVATRFRQFTVQCLTLIDFAKPSLSVLEALVMHSRGEYHRSKETNTGVWILNATIVRLAMRMGLHRDASHYPTIEPFFGEMRRRLWAWISMSDVLYSQQAAMPSMIRSQDCDTALPSNIFDEEFDDTSAVLPDARPLNQFTPVTYMIAKASLTRTLNQVLDNSSQLAETSHDEVMRLDAELSNTYQTMPSVLRATDEVASDQPAVMHMRYSIAMLYHKSMCVLHREFLLKCREDDRYRENRRRCIDSAIKLLQYQAIMHYEGRPNGRLPGLAWYDASIATNDFLLGATIVSLDLWRSAEANSAGGPNEDVATWGHDRMPEMRQAIGAAREIWSEQRNISMEAFKAWTVLGVMIGKIDGLGAATSANHANGPSQAYPYTPTGLKTEPYTQGQDEEKPEQQAAMTLGMLSTGLGQTPGTSQQSPNGYSGAYPTPASGQPTPGALAAAARAVQDLNNVNNDEMSQTAQQFANFFQPGMQSIDWNNIDNFIVPTNGDPDPSMADLANLNVNWGNDQALQNMVESTNMDLPTQPGDLNTNLFANGGFLGTNQPM